MKSTMNRLEALEADLRPKQVICRMLDRMAAFTNLDDYLYWCYTDEALAQMATTRENMFDAVKRQTGSKDARAINRACHKASREFNFLYDLAMEPSQKLDANRYRYLFATSTLAHWAGSLWRKLQKDGGLDALLEDVRQAKRTSEPILVEMLCIRMASEAIARKYFQGRPLYFKQQQLFLERLIAHTEQMMEHLNEAIDLLKTLSSEPETWRTLRIDLETLHAMAEQSVAARVERLEQEARIALYGTEGRHDEAVRQFQRMIQR